MFFKKKEDKINYENIVEIWLTPKQYSTKYEVKTFYDKDNRYIKAKTQTMSDVETLDYIDDVKLHIKMYKVEIEGRTMYRNKELYNKIFKKDHTK